MTQLTRRSALLGTAAAALAPALASMPARAAAPAIGKQNAGFYRYKVGTHEVTVVTDGANRFRFPDAFVVNKNRDEVNAAWAALYGERTRWWFRIRRSW